CHILCPPPASHDQRPRSALPSASLHLARLSRCTAAVRYPPPTRYGSRSIRFRNTLTWPRARRSCAPVAHPDRWSTHALHCFVFPRGSSPSDCPDHRAAAFALHLFAGSSFGWPRPRSVFHPHSSARPIISPPPAPVSALPQKTSPLCLLPTIDLDSC